MRTARVNILSVTLVLAFLGFLAVVQLRSQSTDAALAALSVQDLGELVANLTARNNELRDEIRDLDAQRAALSATVQRGDSSAVSIRNDLQRMLAWSGVLGIRGPGITVTLSGAVPAATLNDLVNELWNAGAEGVSLDGIRIVPGLVAAGTPSAITLAGSPLVAPYELLAVGQPEALAGSLTRVGGIIAQLAAQYPDVPVSVTPLDLVELPATTRDLSPILAKPRV